MKTGSQKFRVRSSAFFFNVNSFCFISWATSANIIYVIRVAMNAINSIDNWTCCLKFTAKWRAISITTIAATLVQFFKHTRFRCFQLEKTNGKFVKRKSSPLNDFNHFHFTRCKQTAFSVCVWVLIMCTDSCITSECDGECECVSIILYYSMCLTDSTIPIQCIFQFRFSARIFINAQRRHQHSTAQHKTTNTNSSILQSDLYYYLGIIHKQQQKRTK